MPRTLLSLFLLIASLSAQKIVRVNGEGADREAALTQALVAAVRQVHGVSVESSRSQLQGVDKMLTEFRGRFTEMLVAPASRPSSGPTGAGPDRLDDERVSAIATLASKGLVKSYKILGERTENGRVALDVEATVEHFDPDRPWGLDLPSLLVLASAVPAEAVQVDEAGFDANALTDAIAARARTLLMNCNRWHVVDPTLVRRILGEVPRALPAKAAASLAELGTRIPAHLVLMIDVDLVRVRVATLAPGGAAVVLQHDVQAEVSGTARVVDVTAGKIRELCKRSFGRSLERSAIAGDPAPDLARATAARLAGACAEDLCWAVLEETKPVRVARFVAAGDGQKAQLFLNLGGELVALGQELTVVTPGAEIRDPDTNAVLGTTERQLGKVRVTKVLAKMAIAEPVGELAGEPPIGAFCRRVAAGR